MTLELRGSARPTLQQALRWIGSRVDDIYGASIGKLEDIWMDPDSGEPLWLLVRDGRIGGRHTLVPFAQAASGAGHVWIPFEREVVRGAPAVRPSAPLSHELSDTLRRYYSESGHPVGDAAPRDDAVRVAAPQDAAAEHASGFVDQPRVAEPAPLSRRRPQPFRRPRPSRRRPQPSRNPQPSRRPQPPRLPSAPPRRGRRRPSLGAPNRTPTRRGAPRARSAPSSLRSRRCRLGPRCRPRVRRPAARALRRRPRRASRRRGSRRRETRPASSRLRPRGSLCGPIRRPPRRRLPRLHESPPPKCFTSPSAKASTWSSSVACSSAGASSGCSRCPRAPTRRPEA